MTNGNDYVVFQAHFTEILFGRKCSVKVLVNPNSLSADAIVSWHTFAGPDNQIQLSDLHALIHVAASMKEHVQLIHADLDDANLLQIVFERPGISLKLTKPVGPKEATYALTVGPLHHSGNLSAFSISTYEHASARLEKLVANVILRCEQVRRNSK